jgi:hypothetical protein
MYLYCVVKTARFLPKMATNTLEMVGFSTEKYWFLSFQESSSYTNSTENTEKVLSEKTVEFEGKSWRKCHDIADFVTVI